MAFRPLVRLILALSLLSAILTVPPGVPSVPGVPGIPGVPISPPPAAAQAAFAFPLTVTDDAGASTTFWAPPRRIVSLSPGHTETIFALGAGDRLVAVDTYSDFPAEAAAIQPRLSTER